MKPVRLGLAGLGVMGAFYAKNLLEEKISNCRLAALCDQDIARGAQFPNCRFFSNYEEMLHSGAIDAVLIATPHYFHTSLGVAALAAGLHVLVEKPISVHKADCLRLLSAPRQDHQVFAVMFNMRTFPVFQKIKQMIDSGETGEIRRVQWSLTDWFRTQAYYNRGGWRGTWKGEGGGVLINQCPHQLDLLQWMFGMPERIYAKCSFGRYHKIEVEDDVAALMEYSDGVTLQFSASTGEAPGTNRLEIAGDMGRLTLENGKLIFRRNEASASEVCRTSLENTKPPAFSDLDIPFAVPEGGGHLIVLQNFVDAIQHGNPLISPAEEGIHSVELANAMILSSLRKQPVDLPIDAENFAKQLHRLIENSAT